MFVLFYSHHRKAEGTLGEIRADLVVGIRDGAVDAKVDRLDVLADSLGAGDASLLAQILLRCLRGRNDRLHERGLLHDGLAPGDARRNAWDGDPDGLLEGVGHVAVANLLADGRLAELLRLEGSLEVGVGLALDVGVLFGDLLAGRLNVLVLIVPGQRGGARHDANVRHVGLVGRVDHAVLVLRRLAGVVLDKVARVERELGVEGHLAAVGHVRVEEAVGRLLSGLRNVVVEARGRGDARAHVEHLAEVVRALEANVAADNVAVAVLGALAVLVQGVAVDDLLDAVAVLEDELTSAVRLLQEVVHVHVEVVKVRDRVGLLVAQRGRGLARLGREAAVVVDGRAAHDADKGCHRRVHGGRRDLRRGRGLHHHDGCRLAVVVEIVVAVVETHAGYGGMEGGRDDSEAKRCSLTAPQSYDKLTQSRWHDDFFIIIHY
jgi:hypothetical protein